MASVVTQRTLGMTMNIIMLIIEICLAVTETQVSIGIFNFIIFITVAIAATLILILTLSIRSTWSKRAINILVRAGKFVSRGKWKQKLEHLEEEALRAAKIFHSSMNEFIQKPRTLFIPTLFVSLNWICSVSVPYLVFLSLGLKIPWSVVLITGAIVAAVKAIPIGIPFEVGLPEITMTTLYTSLLGTQYAPISVTATILNRIITLGSDSELVSLHSNG